MPDMDRALRPEADRAAGLRPQPATPSSRSSIPSAFDDGYLAALRDVMALTLKWRDENRQAASKAGRQGNKSMQHRLDGSATECHALAGELIERAKAIEARRAETVGLGAQHESAVANGHSPIPTIGTQAKDQSNDQG